MKETNVAPVNHNLGSATVTTAVETGKGGVKGFIKGSLIVAAITVAAVTGLGFLLGGIGGLLGAAVLGSILAIGTGLAGGGFGSVFGAIKGAAHGVSRVGQEQGAANVVQAQVAAYQAQAVAANKYNFPAQGSSMNQADTSISSVQSDGRIDGLQLQRA